MAQSLEDVKRTLRERLDELRPLVEEYRELERAAAALGEGGEERERERAAPARPRKAAAAPRAPRGANKRAVLDVIAERPGVSVGEIAEITRVARPLVYGVTRAGVERGELEAVELGGGRKGFKRADASPEGEGTGRRPAGKTLDEATEGIEDPEGPPPVGA